MQQARMLGNYVEQQMKKSDLSVEDLSNTLHCSDNKAKAFLKGMVFLSFEQLENLSGFLNIPVSELLQGDEKLYNATVVHCMNEFDDPHNRETVLDLIYDYLDVVNSLKE